MVGWHHRLDGHEFEQALGVGDGQGILAFCILWGHKERLNELIWNKIWIILYIVILPIFIQLFHRDVSSEVKLPSILLASYVTLTNLYFMINLSLNESISIYLIKLC